MFAIWKPKYFDAKLGVSIWSGAPRGLEPSQAPGVQQQLYYLLNVLLTHTGSACMSKLLQLASPMRK